MFRKFFCILTILIMVTTATMTVYATNGDNNTNAGQTAGAQKTGDDKSAKNDPGKDTPEKDISSKNAPDKDGAASDKSDVDAAAAEKAEKIQADNQSLIDDVLKNGDVNDTGLITMTKPDKDSDATIKKTYVITGFTKYTDVKIFIARYNNETKKYDEEILDTDGENSWDAGEGGGFCKEAVLKKGQNKIKLIAFRTSALGEGFKAEDIFVDTFTISCIQESIISKVFKAFTDIIPKSTDDKANDPVKK